MTAAYVYEKSSNMESFSHEQKEAVDAIREGASVFLTGPGGTGKSFLIKSLHTLFPEKNISVTALTGCAALLLGGGAKTLHSWAGIGLGRGAAAYHALNIRKIPALAKRWRTTNILVIDEVSMLTPDLLELLDEIARILRRSDRPMGGMQVVFVGDFLQLPPISKGQETRFAFESPIWHLLVNRTIHLKRIFRQEDVNFQKILDEVRIGEISKESFETLELRKDLDWSTERIQPTILFTRKVDVDAINQSHLDELPGECKIYTTKTLPVEGHTAADIRKIVERMDKESGYVPELYLKLGAQVMLLVNMDMDAGLVNGSRGVVDGFQETYPYWPIVEFRNGQKMSIGPETWESDHERSPIQREQIPLRLAYALTIHKSQGATLDCVIIDIGTNIFEYGQAYVALSRVKSLEGLYIHDLSMRAFRAHPLVKEFYRGRYNAPVAPLLAPQPVKSDKLPACAFLEEDTSEPVRPPPDIRSFFGGGRKA